PCRADVPGCERRLTNRCTSPCRYYGFPRYTFLAAGPASELFARRRSWHSMRRTVAAIAMAVFLLVGCQRDASAPAPRRPQGEKPAVEPDETGLQGDWIEVHALAKEQPMGKGDYYVWVFSEDRVTWRFHNTIDGKPIDGKTIGTGTFKID